MYDYDPKKLDELYEWLFDIDKAISLKKYEIIFKAEYNYESANKKIRELYNLSDDHPIPRPASIPNSEIWVYNGSAGGHWVKKLIYDAQEVYLKEITVSPRLVGRRSVARKRIEASGLTATFTIPVTWIEPEETNQ